MGDPPLPCTYLREVHLGMAEGDAFDVGQWETMLSEPLCKRKVGAQGLMGRAIWQACWGGSVLLPFSVPSQGPSVAQPLKQAVPNSKQSRESRVYWRYHQHDITIYKCIGLYS